MLNFRDKILQNGLPSQLLSFIGVTRMYNVYVIRISVAPSQQLNWYGVLMRSHERT